MSMGLRKSSGQIKILNTEIDDINIMSQGSKMGICPQDNTIWNELSVD
jgi:ABC-type transport system involved in Fe-S cluster assembly fused permease/ATPase subunit